MQKHIFNIHDVVLFMTMAECILLVIFQTMLPVRNKLANRLLSTFLVSIAVACGCILILWNSDVQVFSLFDDILLPYFLVAAQLLKGPVLLLYVASLTEEAFKLRRNYLLHLLPIVLAFIWLAVFNITSSDLRFRNLGHTQFEIQVANWVWHFIKLVPLVYGIAAFSSVRRYRIGLHNQYSSFSPIEPSWLNILSLGFLLTWSFSMVVHLIANTVAINYPNISDSFGIAENYVMLIDPETINIHFRG